MRVVRIVSPAVVSFPSPSMRAGVGSSGISHSGWTCDSGSSLVRRRARRRMDEIRPRRRRRAPASEMGCRQRLGGRIHSRRVRLRDAARTSIALLRLASRRISPTVTGFQAFRRSLRRCRSISRRARRPFKDGSGRDRVEVRFDVGAKDKDAVARFAAASLARRVGRSLGIAYGRVSVSSRTRADCRCKGYLAHRDRISTCAVCGIEVFSYSVCNPLPSETAVGRLTARQGWHARYVRLGLFLSALLAELGSSDPSGGTDPRGVSIVRQS